MSTEDSDTPYWNGPEAHECRGDFWLVLRESILQAGAPASMMDDIANAPLTEVVDMLAQNGLRMVYFPEAHINGRRQLNLELHYDDSE